MIAKKIAKKIEIKSSFGNLARYIANILDKGEKLQFLYSQNLSASQNEHDSNFALDNLEAMISEVNFTQSLNNSQTSDKNYHLIISFHEREQPNFAQTTDIVNEYCRALGFADHQRLVACHINTIHTHIHVAINRVHPATLKCHAPSFDFLNLEKTSRAMELKHGFQIDNGMSDSPERKSKIQNIANDIEAHSWQQSFYSYCQEHKPFLQEIIATAQSWQEIHTGFAKVGLTIKKSANGLAIGDLHSKKHIKASDCGREFAKNALEKQFGGFKVSDKLFAISDNTTKFEAKPITKHPKTTQYFQKFQAMKRPSFVSNKQLKQAGIFTNSFKLYLQYLSMEGDLLALAIMKFHQKSIAIIAGLGE